MSRSLRNRFIQKMVEVARSQDEVDPALYVGLGLFQILRDLNREISSLPPSQSEQIYRRREIRRELHQIVHGHFANVAFSEAIGNFIDYVAQSSRGPIFLEIDQLPYALKEGIYWHLRQEFAGPLREVPPEVLHHYLGTVLGRIVRHTYLRVIREGWAQSLFKTSDFTIDQEIYNRDWEEMEGRARAGNYSLELTAESFFRTRLLENLVRQVREEWGEVHPLWEGFQREAFRGMSGFSNMEDFWQHLQEGSRILERLNELQPAEGEFSRGDEIFPGDSQALPPMMDPGFSIISMMPRTIKDAVFGDLEMMDHQFVAGPSHAVALRLVRTVWADTQVQMPEPFASRGVDAQDLHRAAQWVRIKMADLYRDNRAYYDRMLEFYFSMVAEASVEEIQWQIRRLPRELSSDLEWEVGREDPEMAPVQDLFARGYGMGNVFKTAYLELLLFGQEAHLFNLESEGFSQSNLAAWIEETERDVDRIYFTTEHLDHIRALENFIRRVQTNWGAFHPFNQGFREAFPEYEHSGPRARRLRELRREVEAFVRQGGGLH